MHSTPFIPSTKKVQRQLSISILRDNIVHRYSPSALVIQDRRYAANVARALRSFERCQRHVESCGSI